MKMFFFTKERERESRHIKTNPFLRRGTIHFDVMARITFFLGFTLMSTPYNAAVSSASSM